MSRRPRGGPGTASELLNQALDAGRTALKEAQRRLPPDWRRQLEARVSEALKPIQTQLRSRAAKEDVERLSRRVEELARAVEGLSEQVQASNARRTRNAAEDPITGPGEVLPRRRPPRGSVGKEESDTDRPA